MFWTPELADTLVEAPWPATREELIDYANRSGLPQQVIDNICELDEGEEIYEGIEDIWPEYEGISDEFFYNDDEEEQYY